MSTPDEPRNSTPETPVSRVADTVFAQFYEARRVTYEEKAASLAQTILAKQALLRNSRDLVVGFDGIAAGPIRTDLPETASALVRSLENLLPEHSRTADISGIDPLLSKITDEYSALKTNSDRLVGLDKETAEKYVTTVLASEEFQTKIRGLLSGISTLARPILEELQSVTTKELEESQIAHGLLAGVADSVPELSTVEIPFSPDTPEARERLYVDMLVRDFDDLIRRANRILHDMDEKAPRGTLDSRRPYFRHLCGVLPAFARAFSETSISGLKASTDPDSVSAVTSSQAPRMSLEDNCCTFTSGSNRVIVTFPEDTRNDGVLKFEVSGNRSDYESLRPLLEYVKESFKLYALKFAVGYLASLGDDGWRDTNAGWWRTTLKAYSALLGAEEKLKQGTPLSPIKDRSMELSVQQYKSSPRGAFERDPLFFAQLQVLYAKSMDSPARGLSENHSLFPCESSSLGHSSSGVLFFPGAEKETIAEYERFVAEINRYMAMKPDEGDLSAIPTCPSTPDEAGSLLRRIRAAAMAAISPLKQNLGTAERKIAELERQLAGVSKERDNALTGLNNIRGATGAKMAGLEIMTRQIETTMKAGWGKKKLPPEIKRIVAVIRKIREGDVPSDFSVDWPKTD